MGYKENNDIGEGLEYSMRVDAKGARGEGIGRIGDFVIFVKNAKTRIGNVYKVKVTKIHRTFAYAELKDSKQQFIGNGSLVDFG
jgi:predicted RNA-binding protein with TRAM domain